MKLRHKRIGGDRDVRFPLIRGSEGPENRLERPDSSREKSNNQPPGTSKHSWRQILSRTKEKIKEHNLSIIAAGVAFYIFLGLIPALGALISIYGLVSDPATIQEQMRSLSGFMPQDVIKILDEQMTRIAQQSAGATLGAIFGILLALWSGAKAVKAVMMGLNIIYDEVETRGFFRLNGTALGLTLGGTMGLIAAVAIIVAAPSLLKNLGFGEASAQIVGILRWPLLAFLALVGFAFIYRYGPDREREGIRWLGRGVIFATVTWLMLSAGFSFYAAQFGNYNKTYGSLAAVVVLLLWFLLSTYVLLVGAELNSELEKTE